MSHQWDVADLDAGCTWSIFTWVGIDSVFLDQHWDPTSLSWDGERSSLLCQKAVIRRINVFTGAMRVLIPPAEVLAHTHSLFPALLMRFLSWAMRQKEDLTGGCGVRSHIPKVTLLLSLYTLSPGMLVAPHGGDGSPPCHVCLGQYPTQRSCV